MSFARSINASRSFKASSISSSVSFEAVAMLFIISSIVGDFSQLRYTTGSKEWREREEEKTHQFHLRSASRSPRPATRSPIPYSRAQP